MTQDPNSGELHEKHEVTETETHVVEEGQQQPAQQDDDGQDSESGDSETPSR